LVTGASKPHLWIERAFGKGGRGAYVRLAVKSQEKDLGAYYWSMVETLSQRSDQSGWGSIFKATPEVPFEETIRKALQYVLSFDISEVEVLVHPDCADSAMKAVAPEFVTPVTWFKTPCCVVVPRDRDFLGALLAVSPGRFVGIVHNASRGFAMAVPTAGVAV